MKILIYKDYCGLHIEINFKSGKLIDISLNKKGIHFERGRWEF